MKQLTTTLNGKEILMVEVPEDHWCHHIEEEEPDRLIGYPNDGGGGTKPIGYWRNLPGADWKVVGLCSEIKEEIAAGLVEHFNKVVRGYKDYSPGTRYEQLFATAVESLHSFVKSHNFNPETTVILIKE